MGYFDFVMSEVHGLRIKELLDAQQAGRKVVGLVLRLRPRGAGPGRRRRHGRAVRRAPSSAPPRPSSYLPRNTCALIKCVLRVHPREGLPVPRGLRPDRRREHLRRQEEGLRDLQGPRPEPLRHGPARRPRATQGRALLAGEYRRFAAELEGLSGRKITVETPRRGHRDGQRQARGHAPAGQAARRRPGADLRPRRAARRTRSTSTTTRCASPAAVNDDLRRARGAHRRAARAWRPRARRGS